MNKKVSLQVIQYMCMGLVAREQGEFDRTDLHGYIRHFLAEKNQASRPAIS
jgi:hypothetical protein